MSVGDDTISLTKAHKSKARRLIARGHYLDMSALVNDAVRQLNTFKSVGEPPTKELKALIEKRSKGKFITMKESSERIDRMIARARKRYGV